MGRRGTFWRVCREGVKRDVWAWCLCQWVLGCTLMTAVLLALHAQWRGVSPSAFCTLRGALRWTSMRTTSGLPLRAALLQVQVQVHVEVRCEGGVGRILFSLGQKGESR
jgi:hypothetical protein